MPGMRRREFVSLFGGAAASSPAWSRVAHAQQRTPTIDGGDRCQQFQGDRYGECQ